MSADKFEKIAGAPAEFLEKTIETSREIGKSIEREPHVRKAVRYWNSMGPGLTTGASDDDPAGIGTYSQAGAQYGNQLLWLAGFTFPLMAIVQEMCARIGLVTGRGLAGNIRRHFPRWILYTCTILLVAANIFNLGADIGAMAKSAQLLMPKTGFTVLVIIFAAITLALQIFTSYEKYANILKWLAMILVSYILSTLAIRDLDWADILRHAVIPSLTFSRDQIILICAILGTTISPYLFFWQTAQEVEEEILKGSKSIKMREGATRKEIKSMRTDVWSGMFFSNVIMFFIIAATSSTLYRNGITDITSADQAAQSLKPFAGDAAYFLFALGIIGTGFLAIPVLAGSASYAISESFRWKFGLYRKLKEASAFYGVIIISVLTGVIMNLMGIDPIRALVWSAIGNGLISPFILAAIVSLSSSRKVMGEHVNNPLITATGWLITALMTAAGIATVAALFF